jgi:MoaA/NifB/PqqE/SkfB family radical SAM enzyme
MMRLKYDPHTLIVDQTIKCNQACFFCWRADKKKVSHETREAPWMTLPFDMYRRIIDAAVEVESMRQLSLCGPMGEPTLVEDLVERGDYATKKGKFSRYVMINTNGYALHKFDARALLQAFSHIVVSVDAVDAKIHESIHGKAGQIERILENVKHLAAAKKQYGGAVIEVRFTENDKNHGHWPDFQRYFADIPIDRIRHKKVHSFIDVLPELENNAGAILCNQPRGNINFSFRGEMTTCCINYKPGPVFGHIDDGRSLKEMWESEAFETWRRERHEGICKGCSGLGAAGQRGEKNLRYHDVKKLAAIREKGEFAYFEAACA